MLGFRLKTGHGSKDLVGNSKSAVEKRLHGCVVFAARGAAAGLGLSIEQRAAGGFVDCGGAYSEA